MKAVSAAVYHGVLMGAGHEYRAVREGCAQAAAAQPFGSAARCELENLDALVIEHLLEAESDEVWPAILNDDPAQPRERWWWHLGAIRAGTYPPDLLPEHLRAVYRAAADQTS